MQCGILPCNPSAVDTWIFSAPSEILGVTCSTPSDRCFSRRCRGVSVRKELIGFHQKALAALCKVPIPLWYWTGLRRVVGCVGSSHDLLFPLYSNVASIGGNCSTASLQQILRNEELGVWAIDQETIELIWNLLHQEEPCTILECGSGVSTIVFAKYFAGRQGSIHKQFRIISLEQDAEWVDRITARLRGLNLTAYARILHAPVSDQGVYLVSDDELGRALNGDLADWIFIDAPSGPEGCRRETLPMLKHFCRAGARWLLDDAFRDGELDFLREWHDRQQCAVVGIWPIGKGLATGFVGQNLVAQEEPIESRCVSPRSHSFDSSRPR
jgi:hypothetical protein